MRFIAGLFIFSALCSKIHSQDELMTISFPADRDYTLNNISISENLIETQQFRATKFVIPAICITYGLIARFNETPVRRFDKYIGREVDEHIHRAYRMDDYLQYTPAMAVYGIDFLPGVQAKHNFRDRTLVMATSYLATLALVQISKFQIDELRPNGRAHNSFPSGHTAVAFTGAHILFREYNEASPWISVAGYAVATATGAMRVVNKAHWLNDVVTGAGVGILSAEIGYLMLPVWHRLFGLDDSSVLIMPSVSTQGAGAGMIYVF
ncbi:MAG: phosphatase PAP2 family protein [Tannerella sp.]|jgi:membrane-associated phospholipid phosphatase|nr:phosphatase PAP2 family protein [Tannerella sp.]